MKKNSNSPMKKEQTSKRAKSQRPVQRETKEVLAELVEKLRGKLERKATPASLGAARQRRELSPNLDRLTVGVDVPMTGRERWTDYLHQNFAQPGAFFQTFFTGLGDQTGNVPSNWGRGASVFPQRLGSEFARFAIGGTIESTIDAGLQQDTRFFRCVCHGAVARSVHAVSRTLLTYNRDGRRRLDIGGIAGIYGGPMVMTTWFPRSYTAIGYGIRQGNLAAGITTGIYVIREFSPELKRLFRRRDTTDERVR